MQTLDKAQIMDADALRRAVNRIAYEIIEKNKGCKDLTVIGIRRRGAVLAGRIAQKLSDTEGIEVPCSTLDISRYRDDLKDKSARFAKDDELFVPIEGRTVVLVDDVLFTGRTVRAAIDAILDRGRAQRIQLAVLIDRGHRELPFRPDFVGKNLPTSLDESVRVLVNEYDGEEKVVILKKRGGV